MFDVGFWELCLVGLVSLLVIGPERLPKAARLAGFWVSKTRNMVAAVQAEIRQELNEEEIRQALQQQQQSLDSFKDIITDETNAVISDLEKQPETTQNHDRE